MNFIQEAADMNRRGVFYLYSGETKYAYESFIQARTLIMSHICTNALKAGGSSSSPILSDSLLQSCLEYNNNSTNERVGQGDSTAILGSADNKDSEMINTIASIHPVKISNLEDDKLYIYNCAMIFQPKLNSCYNNSNDKDDINESFLYTATILHNIALCLHCIGKVNYDSNMLLHSAQMYEMCLQLLPSFPNQYCKERTLLGIIALNNSAQIYHETQGQNHIGNNGNLQHSLNSLSQIMNVFCLASSSDAQSLQKNFDISIHEVLKNVVVLSNPNYQYFYGAPCA